MKRHRERRLRLEQLEHRRVLAITNLASITGVAFQDLTDDGLTGDDVRQAGATINLWRDGGNGTFDNGGGDDTSEGSTTTDGTGSYTFSSLTADTYFVEQVAIAGLQQKTGENVSTVTISSTEAEGVIGVQIDSFTTAQTVTATAPASASNSVIAAEAIGGERDMEVTATAGDVSLISNAAPGNILEFGSSALGTGMRRIVWDGVDGSTVVNATGLGGVDLTAGGTQSGIKFQIGADQVGSLRIVIHTDGANSSELTPITISNTGGSATDVMLAQFASFTTLSGTGADFTNVGAIELEITGPAGIDGQANILGAVGDTIKTANFAHFAPMTLGDLVFFDDNNNGVFDSATESGIPGVTVNLYEDTNASGDFTNGVDVLQGSTTTNGSGNFSFANLFPGDYILQIAESDFGGGGVLDGLETSTGNDPAPDPDDDVNDDDNGLALAGFGVVTAAVTLTNNAEPTTDGDADNNTNLAVDFGVVPEADLSITKTDNPDPVDAAQTLTYQLVVTNNGPNQATNVVATDTLPAGVTYVTATTTQGSVSETGGVVTATIGTLADSGTATIDITVTVDNSTSGAINNTASVTGDQVDPNTANNSVTEATTVTPRVDLTLTKSDSPDAVIAGQALVYTVTVTNGGPSTATNVQVVDTLPAGVSYGSGSSTQGSVSETGGVVTADVGTLASGASATITINTTVLSSTAVGTITNSATASSTESELNAADNSVSEDTTVNRQIELSIVKSDSPDPVIAGEQLTYTLTVSNAGPSDASGVTVTDVLPAGVAFSSVVASQGSASEAGGTVTGNLGTIASGSAATVTIVVDVDSSFTGAISNTASVTGTETDSNTGNNSATINTTANAEVDLTITKADSSEPVLAGNPLTYTLVVTNNGPSDATGVVVTDNLPTEVTFSTGSATQGTVTETGGVVTATVGSLASGASATITIETVVGPTVSGTITNNASVAVNETERTPADNSVMEDTLVDLVMSTIGGFVYIDLDNDGIRDVADVALPGATVSLSGTDLGGNPVSQTTQTSSSGAYTFSNLVAGTYQVQETQPTPWADGMDTQGTPALGTVTDDLFSAINLTAGTNAVDFNFGELVPFSKRDFLNC